MSNAKTVNWKANKNARAIFASLTHGAHRRLETECFGGTAEVAHIQGRDVVHTYMMIANHKGDQVIEFARISRHDGTGRLEVYRYDSKGAASFVGYADEVCDPDIYLARKIGENSGFGMFRVRPSV